jgi:hypothetical protein
MNWVDIVQMIAIVVLGIAVVMNAKAIRDLAQLVWRRSHEENDRGSL